ncbi:MAG: LLM class flavin-dependent oxidoreductase [Actinobacteria bacterium]|nr:LLM class flavin-dependent oxidoreductase [Actinomycetota bacterium]
MIPDPALVVLVGPSGAGKSTWASQHFRPDEIVSSDRLRAMAGSSEHDLDASAVAFKLLDEIVASRLQRKLTAVVDTLGFDDDRRLQHLQMAHESGLPAVVVLFAETDEVCRDRNRRKLRPVPAAVLTQQFRRLRQLNLEAEGWDLLLHPEPSLVSTVSSEETPAPSGQTTGRFYLQLSRFPQDRPLGPWLREMAVEAERVGFAGLAVMDHLTQIPQVGREWEPIPEAYTALAFLAATTNRLELGCLVTGARLRNPALLAKMLATLDVVSGGRAFCGLGAGWFDQELRAYGFRQTEKRFAQLEDTINILRRMWAPGKASYSGRVHSIVEAVCYPKPLHPIPILVGGNGEKTREIALRLADGLNLVGLTNAERLLPEVKEKAEGFAISVLDTPLIGKNRSEVAERVERWRGSRSAATFAKAHHASTAADHLATYRRLHSQGCDRFFLAPVGLEEPGQLAEWEPVLASWSS